MDPFCSRRAGETGPIRGCRGPKLPQRFNRALPIPRTFFSKLNHWRNDLYSSARDRQRSGDAEFLVQPGEVCFHKSRDWMMVEPFRGRALVLLISFSFLFFLPREYMAE